MIRFYRVPDSEVRALGHKVDESLRLPGHEEVKDPDAADVILVPVSLADLPDAAALRRFPVRAGRERRCVWFHVSDHEQVFGEPDIFVRCNVREWMLKSDPNTVSWTWPTEDWMALGAGDLPVGGFTHDVAFHGWEYKSTTTRAVASCRAAGVSCDFAVYRDFAGYLWKDGKPLPEFTRRRALMIDATRRCRLQLCPESIPGVLRYRVTEAVSAGRVPVVVTSGGVLPWTDEVPWREFCVFVEERNAESVGQVCREFLRTHSDEDILTMGRFGRTWWESRMNRDKWPELMSLAIERKARALGLVRDGR